MKPRWPGPADWKGLVALLILGCVLGLAVNSASPRGIDLGLALGLKP